MFVLGSIAYAPYAFRKYDRLHDLNSIVIEVERSKNLKEIASKLGGKRNEAVHVAVKRSTMSFSNSFAEFVSGGQR